MLSSTVFPGECCALSIITKVAARPGWINPQSRLRIRAVFPVAKHTATSAGTSASDDSIEIILKIPSGCTPDPAGESVPRITVPPLCIIETSVSSSARKLANCTLASAPARSRFPCIVFCSHGVFSVAILGSAALPRWLGLAAAFGAVLQPVAWISFFAPSGILAAGALPDIVAFAALLAWLAAGSVTMLARPPSE